MEAGAALSGAIGGDHRRELISVAGELSFVEPVDLAPLFGAGQHIWRTARYREGKECSFHPPRSHKEYIVR